MKIRNVMLVLTTLILWFFAASAYAIDRGIYITQSTLEDTKAITYLTQLVNFNCTDD